MDSQDRPVFIDSYDTTISPGDSIQTSFSYAIPTGASTGTYRIRAMAWSDWLPDGIVLAPEAMGITFEVT